MKENFERSYIAVPIMESPLLTRVRELNNYKNFFHMTLYFLGQISDVQLENIKERFKDGASFLKKIVLDPVKFEAIGPNEKTYVLKLQENESIMQLRGFLENCLPGFHQQNLPFVPHITILNHKHFDKHLSFKTPDQKIEPYTAKSVGIYYKTEEGATALLYSHKI